MVWRYNPTIDKIEIGAYVYDNKVRTYEKIGEVDIGATCTLAILPKKDSYYFNIISGSINFTTTFTKSHKNIFSYPLGVYFGGNQVAPHDITVKMDKV